MPEPNSGCWLWLGGMKGTRSNYGNVKVNKQSFRAHRVAWTRVHGPIPDGLGVLHACDTPPCVNPDHLFLGTQKDNNRDMARKCRYGYLATLTAEQVLAIRGAYRQGVKSPALASRFKVNRTTICRIVRGLTWRFVTC